MVENAFISLKKIKEQKLDKLREKLVEPTHAFIFFYNQKKTFWFCSRCLFFSQWAANQC